MYLIGTKSDLLVIPFEDIPTNFVSSTLTVLQKEIIQIKYYIKLALDNWTDSKAELHEKLSPQLRLSVHRVNTLTKGLPRQIASEDIICPCCKEEFKLKPQAYWSYVDPDYNIRLLKSEDIHILCSRKCSENLNKPVNGLSERRFYYIENEVS